MSNRNLLRVQTIDAGPGPFSPGGMYSPTKAMAVLRQGISATETENAMARAVITSLQAKIATTGVQAATASAVTNRLYEGPDRVNKAPAEVEERTRIGGISSILNDSVREMDCSLVTVQTHLAVGEGVLMKKKADLAVLEGGHHPWKMWAHQ